MIAIQKPDVSVFEGIKPISVNGTKDPVEHIAPVMPLPQKSKTTDTMQYCGFWTNDLKSTNIILSTGALRTHLVEDLGFSILDGQYVQVVDGVIYKRDKNYLYNLIINLVSQEDVTFKIWQRSGEITITIDRKSLETKAQKEIRGNVSMIALPSFDKTILRDTANDVYLHFKNVTLHIRKNSINRVQRNNEQVIWGKQVIWAEQIIDFEIQEDDNIKSTYSQFISNIAGDNKRSFCSAIGMLMRNYNGSDGMRVAWLCDSSYEVGKANGRTGKGIFWKAISKIRKTDECSGKDFTPDYQFKFQNMDHNTQVYAIDDVKPNFDFKSIYNYATEGAEFQKKHQPRVKLSLSETPQLVITSNDPPQIEQGSSTTGRLFILPLKAFYKDYTEQGGVKGYHRHIFFDDWDKDEWNRFYWYMAKCAQLFLNDGLVAADMSQIRANRLRGIAAKKFKSEEIANDFVDWIYQYQVPIEFELEDLINAFNQQDIDTQVFAGCLKAYFDMEQIAFVKARKMKNGKQAMIWSTTNRK